VTDALHGLVLPTIRGESLSGVAWSFPDDLSRTATLLLIAFQQHHQRDVDTWLPAARRLADEHQSFAYFEVPLLDTRWRPARALIDGGMRAGIQDPQVRASTVTAYQSRRAFLRRLGLHSHETIVVVLVDRNGVIRWAARGPATAASAAAFAAAVDGITP
jgi:hypothetical protein